MERFCDRCGSLVSGNVKHCTFCGAEMDKKLVVSSSLDVDTDSIFDNGGFEDGAADTAQSDTAPIGAAQGSTEQTPQDNTPQQSKVQDYVPFYKPQTDNRGGGYIPLYTAQDTKQYGEFTTLRWLGMLVLSMCFGIVSDIILIIWARDNSNLTRRNFARAMLIIAPIIRFGIFMVLLVAAAFILA